MSLKSKISIGLGLAALVFGCESSGCMRLSCSSNFESSAQDDNEWKLRPGINSNGDPTIIIGPKGRGYNYDILNRKIDRGYGF